MLDKFKTYYHTLKYLKWKQIKYRLLYQFKQPLLGNIGNKVLKPKIPSGFKPIITSRKSWLGNNTFQFLNIKQQFETIDWNYSFHGKLWTYNLNYFEFLSQLDMTKQEGLALIRDFIHKEKISKEGIESFPISLRVIFWIKFIIQHQIQDDAINRSLYAQLQLLSSRPEYHLMGNHLLENGFGLLFGACFFEDKNLLRQAQQILLEQLEEQILADGAHFELSPMYHQIMLHRILDCIHLMEIIQANDARDLLGVLKEKASIMLCWLQEMTFSNGDIPLLNDSAFGIAPNSNELLKYATELGMKWNKSALKESGYRKFSNENYEIIVDVGNIGPDYIPGHAHSDTFNFVLYHRGNPLIVDPGITTYEKNTRRNLERSTVFHNTVMIAEREQSEIWGGFRVAKRAKVTDLQESENQIIAIHNGYQDIKCSHQRTFAFEQKTITIEDRVEGNQTKQAFFHFHPEVSPQLKKQSIHGKDWMINFKESVTINLVPYLFSLGFNQSQEALKAVVIFKQDLHSKISLQ